MEKAERKPRLPEPVNRLLGWFFSLEKLDKEALDSFVERLVKKEKQDLEDTQKIVGEVYALRLDEAGTYNERVAIIAEHKMVSLSIFTDTVKEWPVKTIDGFIAGLKAARRIGRWDYDIPMYERLLAEVEKIRDNKEKATG